MKVKKNLLGVLLFFLIFRVTNANCELLSTRLLSSQGNIGIISAGTGFFISAEGHIATCAHVVEDSWAVGIWIGGKRYRADIVAINKKSDVAILKTDHRPAHFFQLANFDSANIGERIFALGFPLTDILGSDIRLTDGIISAMSGYESDQTNFQISAPIQPGNSGSPVFNERFKVFGIAASGLRPWFAANVGFAIKNTQIISLLPQNVKIREGNVRNISDAISATVQISVDNVFDGPPITIINNTGKNISSIFISQTATDNWRQNRLSKNQILYNKKSINLKLPFPLNIVNHYNILLVDENRKKHTKMNMAIAANNMVIVFIAEAAESSNLLRKDSASQHGGLLTGLAIIFIIYIIFKIVCWVIKQNILYTPSQNP